MLLFGQNTHSQNDTIVDYDGRDFVRDFLLYTRNNLKLDRPLERTFFVYELLIDAEGNVISAQLCHDNKKYGDSIMLNMLKQLPPEMFGRCDSIHHIRRLKASFHIDWQY